MPNPFKGARAHVRTVTVPMSYQDEAGQDAAVVLFPLQTQHVENLVDVFQDDAVLSKLEAGNIPAAIAMAKDAVLFAVAASSRALDDQGALEAETKADLDALSLGDLGALVVGTIDVTFPQGLADFLSALKDRLGLNSISATPANDATPDTSPTDRGTTSPTPETDARRGPMTAEEAASAGF